MTIDPFAPAVTLAGLLKRKAIGCAELLDFYLHRVKRHNPEINAVVVLDEERARVRAREADAALAAGEDWGPLHGLPMTVKESFNVRGLPTTFGFAEYRDNVADADAVAVDRLRNAGAIIFGKTNVPPALADAQSANDVYGRTNNPWNLERTPGGSSGGSAAALAAGLTALELGSDIASSLRNPAHYCGVFAHKPTYGLCSPEGHTLRPRYSHGDIAVIGPMARSAEDLELELRILAAPPGATALPNLPACRKNSFRDFRIGLVVNDDYAEVDAAIEKCLRELGEFLRGEGATVEVGARPDIDSRTTHVVYELLMRAAISQSLSDADVAALLDEKKAQAAIGSDMRRMYVQGMTMSHREWLLLNEERLGMREKWRAFFAHYDLLLCPVLASTAFPHDRRPPAARTLWVNGREIPFGTQLFWAGFSGASYLPSSVAPIGLAEDGLPIGVQIVGDASNDLSCIRFAQLIEKNYRAFQQPPRYAQAETV